MAVDGVIEAEVLALKAICFVLLAEKIRDFRDQGGAAFELAESCSRVISESHPVGPDPERTKQQALRLLDDIFGGANPRPS